MGAGGWGGRGEQRGGKREGEEESWRGERGVCVCVGVPVFLQSNQFPHFN